MANSSFWKNNAKLTNLVEESHRRDTTGQQGSDTDVTSLVFPAVGAILMLVFGGFLLSSANLCCRSNNNQKIKKNENRDRQIDFTASYDMTAFPRLSPVLQQENNDVVEAVMETYSDLPQYAPALGLVARLRGCNHDNLPETRDVCLSPIREIVDLQTAENMMNNNTEEPSSSRLNVSSGIGSCSQHCSGTPPEDMRTRDEPRCHVNLNTSIDVRQVSSADSHRAQRLSPDDDDNHSPLTQFTLRKWVEDASCNHGNISTEEDKTPSQNPAKWSKTDKLQILKKLQPMLDISRDTDMHTNHTQHNTDRPDVSTVESGRVSRLNLVRAPSSMCIHGNQCPAHCEPSHIDDIRLDDSGRGASCFAESFGESTPRGASAFVDTPRGASAFVDTPRGASAFVDTPREETSAFVDTPRGASAFVDTPRGASSFVDTPQGASAFVVTPREASAFVDTPRGASAFVEQVIPLDSKTHGEPTTDLYHQSTNDFRGASGFAGSVEYLSEAPGTASVTISMATQSEKEDNTLTSFASEKLQNSSDESTGTKLLNENEIREDSNAMATQFNFKGGTFNLNSEAQRKISSTKVEINKQSSDEYTNNKILQDDPYRSSTPKEPSNSSDMRSSCPQMRLGKDARALSGLLKALRREKRHKTVESNGKDTPQTSNNSCCDQSRSLNGEIKVTGRKQAVGKLNVCLFYHRSDNTKPVLYVTVLKAFSLRSEYVQPKDDVRVELSVSTRDADVEKTSTVKCHSTTAVFNHLFVISSIRTRELSVSVLKLVLVSGHSNQQAATAHVPLAGLVSRDKIKKTYLLRRTAVAGPHMKIIAGSEQNLRSPVGSVYLGMKYNAVEEKLLIHVVKVCGLPIMLDTGETDPYAMLVVKHDGKTVGQKMSATKWKQRNPLFDTKYVFESTRVQSTSLQLRIMNNAANHSLIGAVNMGMDSTEDSGRRHWEYIVTHPGVLEERSSKKSGKDGPTELNMPDISTLGIVLGAVLGFIAGAIAVGLTFFCVRKRSKSYNTHEPEGHRSIDYYNSPAQSLTAHTRPVPIQPNIYKLNKQIEEPSDVEDGEERVRVTEPYDHRVMDVISEENGSEAGDDISELAETKSKDDATTTSKRKKLTRGLSLPTTIAPADLVHHSQDILTKHGDTQPCVLETSMFYDTVSKELHVTVIQVTGIPTPDESFLRPPNCSVKMRILPEMLQWQWTRKVSRTVSPVFNETFIVPGFVHNKLRECTVHFVVLDFDHVQDNVYVIGEVFMPLSELRANRLEKISKRVNPLSI